MSITTQEEYENVKQQRERQFQEKTEAEGRISLLSTTITDLDTLIGEYEAAIPTVTPTI